MDELFIYWRFRYLGHDNKTAEFLTNNFTVRIIYLESFNNIFDLYKQIWIIFRCIKTICNQIVTFLIVSKYVFAEFSNPQKTQYLNLILVQINFMSKSCTIFPLLPSNNVHCPFPIKSAMRKLPPKVSNTSNNVRPLMMSAQKRLNFRMSENNIRSILIYSIEIIETIF